MDEKPPATNYPLPTAIYQLLDMDIEVKVDTSKLDRLLADFPAVLARAQRNALVVIGAEVKSQTERVLK